MDDDKIIAGARLLLEGLGVDLNDGNFATTPQRMLKVYKELFSPPDTEWPVFEEDYTDIVVMDGHKFHTLCPHHMLPVAIEASIAYVPNGQVIGASKLIRMIHDSNRGPMTQEKLTNEIIKRVDELTVGTSKGTAIILKGNHGCFSMRGVRCPFATMKTLKWSGVFEQDAWQTKFLSLVGR